MTGRPWVWRSGTGPVIATAIHAGHDLRPEVAACTALDDQTRRREEDPFTDRWADVADTSVVFARSRWEVDVNRSRKRCVYLQPEDCWGLRPWHTRLGDDVVEASRTLYDEFYAELGRVCARAEQRHGAFVVLDLHSYNHRRLGPDGPAADAEANPVVNLGTASIDRRLWGDLVDGFLQDLRDRGLDARENVRFTGAALAGWTHRTFPASGCCLAVDVKKVFMDEHTGELDEATFASIRAALADALPNLVQQLTRLRR